MRASPDTEPLFSPVGRTSGGRSAFTLVELLVSMGVLVLLVLLLSRMLAQTSGIWTAGEASKERLQNVRAITDYIGTELSAALLPVNRRDLASLQLVLNPSGISADYLNRDALFWQAPVATDQSLGDVAEVGYFVVWDDSDASNPRAQLRRFFVNPADPATGTADPNFLIYGNPTAWLSDTILEAVAPGDKAHAYQGLFAENVVGIWFQCLDATGEPITRDAGNAALGNHFDSRRGYVDSKGNQKPGCALPAIVEVGLVQLDSRSAARVGPAQKDAIVELAAQSASAREFVDGAMTSSSLQMIRSDFRSYQTRIYLQNAK